MSIKSATLGAASLLAAAVFAGPALADGMPSRGKIADGPAPRCTTAGNVGLTSDYVFRGISQSSENAAVQGGVDFTCGNFYAGVWGSSVDFGVEGTAEVDIYGGYKMTLGRFALDFGFIYYAYPGIDSDLDADFFELKAAASTEVWKGGTLGGTVFYSPDYFGGTGSVVTVEGAFSQALPKFSIFSPTFSATVGHSYFQDELFGIDPSYTYWNVGATLAFFDKWSLDLRYWDSDSDSPFGSGDITEERFVATMKYTF
jgi:uncharacterized protein (TIGR02001 family)